MNKFIAWDDYRKKTVYDFGETFGTNNLFTYIIGQNEKDFGIEITREGDGKELTDVYQSTGKADIHGNEIYYDFHIVKFKRDDGDSIAEYIGVFHFDQEHLRAIIETSEIDIWSRLWYEADEMSNFEIIGNVKENPELIGEGK
jgi:hypothetical protein